MSIIGKLVTLRKLDMWKYIYYNFCHPRIHIDKGCKIIPYKGTHISVAKGANIYVHADMILNDNKQSGSDAECLILLRENATMNVNGTMQLYYGDTIQVHKDAVLTAGEVHFNTGTTIICGYKITLGNMVTSGRGVFIFDSDHHYIFDDMGNWINKPREVVIEDNVWMGIKSTVLKGSHIKSQTMVAAHSLVCGEVGGNAIIGGAPAKILKKNITWSRAWPKGKDDINDFNR